MYDNLPAEYLSKPYLNVCICDTRNLNFILYNILQKFDGGKIKIPTFYFKNIFFFYFIFFFNSLPTVRAGYKRYKLSKTFHRFFFFPETIRREIHAAVYTHRRRCREKNWLGPRNKVA